MSKLIHLTGGNFILTFITIVLAFIALIINLVTFFISIKKESISKRRKTEYIISVISMVIICIVFSTTAGYYFAMYKLI